jgi:hypothetical protein
VTREHNLKERAVEEAKKFAAFVGYVWVVLSLFDIHKLFIFRAQHLASPIGFKLGLNLVNAIVLGKIVLIGDSLHLGEQLKDKALIYRILFRSAVFAVLLLCFEIVEEVVIGMFHGRTVAQSIPQWGGGGPEGKALAAAMVFLTLIPLFAFMEIRRALGDAQFHALLFENRTTARAAKPETRVA